MPLIHSRLDSTRYGLEAFPLGVPRWGSSFLGRYSWFPVPSRSYYVNDGLETLRLSRGSAPLRSHECNAVQKSHTHSEVFVSWAADES